jgi:hypothetical protein
MVNNKSYKIKEDFLAAKKLYEMESLRKAGKIRTETLEQVKKRYGIK